MNNFVLNFVSNLFERGSRKMMKITKMMWNNYRFGSGKCGTLISAA